MKAQKEVSYASNELSAKQKEHYKHSLVQSQESLWYLFPNETQAGIKIMSPRDLFKSWEDFQLRTDIPRLEALHFVAFNEKPKAKELKDQMELSIKVWMRLCETAVQRLDEPTAGGNTGAKRTAHKLADRKYEVVKKDIPADVKLPPQAKTCMAFFAEKMAKAGHDDAKGIFEISEKEFNEYVVEQAERLKTRQDPWRIFQYYRPQLIQGGFIRLV
jgi:hypothetical protein